MLFGKFTIFKALKTLVQCARKTVCTVVGELSATVKSSTQSGIGVVVKICASVSSCAEIETLVNAKNQNKNVDFHVRI